MPHVLVVGKIHDDGIALLHATPGVTVDLIDDVTLEPYAEAISRADGLLLRTQPMPADVVRRAERLRIVSRHGVGYDAVNVDALTARRIPLAIIGDVNAVPVAEHAMMMILALAKRATFHDRSVRAASWAIRNAFSATELDDKALLILGYGRIGRRLAKLGVAFGMRVASYDPFVDVADMAVAGVAKAGDLMGALGEADFVSIHVPKVGKQALVGASELARMKRTAFIINTARGGLIDETALAAALSANQIAGAGLDVFETEPPNANDVLLSDERVLLSPHSASLTRECAARMSIAAAQNIIDFFSQRLNPRLVVNPSVLES